MFYLFIFRWILHCLVELKAKIATDGGNPLRTTLRFLSRPNLIRRRDVQIAEQTYLLLFVQ